MEVRGNLARKGDSVYCIVDGKGSTYSELDAAIISLTGLRMHQLVVEVIARLAYFFGREEGRFRGTVINYDFPLCDQDRWSEAPDGQCTWEKSAEGLFFMRPDTLGDLRTVLRCGLPRIEVGTEPRATIIMSRGEEGMEIHGRPDEAIEFLRSLFREFNIVLLDEASVLDWVDDDGFLPY